MDQLQRGQIVGDWRCHIRHPVAERSDNTEPQSHVRLLNSRQQVTWSASIMLCSTGETRRLRSLNPSMSDKAIWTKPLARRTLSRVRGRQFVWDDARARLQVIICVSA